MEPVVATVLRDPEPGAVGRITGSLRFIGPLVLAPATVSVLALGIALDVDTDAWNFGQLCVQLGLGLFVGAFLVGAIHQSRTALAATRAAGGGDDPEAAPAAAALALGLPAHPRAAGHRSLGHDDQARTLRRATALSANLNEELDVRIEAQTMATIPRTQ
jgi:hypothetical protein